MKYLCIVILFLSQSTFALAPRNMCVDQKSSHFLAVSSVKNEKEY